MITFIEVKRIAEQKISGFYFSDTDVLSIVDDQIIEKDYAWIFSYSSKKWIETNDNDFAIGGNAPLFISKIDGEISTYRTGLSLEAMISEHEEQNQIWLLDLTEDMFEDVQKLLAVKKILSLTNERVTNLKTCKILQLGAFQRLLKIKEQLEQKNVKTNLRFNPIYIP